MFTVYLINFGYNLTPSFNTFEEAVEAAKKACFECTICITSGPIATWGPICGLVDFRSDRS